MRNAAKHAAPCTVTVRLSRDEDGAVLDVGDDGPGFDVEAVAAATRGRGTSGCGSSPTSPPSGGAHLSVASAPGRGTLWRLRVPDRRAAEDS